MKTVLITGANRGIGLEFCKHYALLQWNVIACCRHTASATELSKLCVENTNVSIYKMDVTDSQSINNLVNNIEGKTIDLLIANAGIYGDSIEHRFGNLNYDDWIKTIETNVFGVVRVIEALIDNLKQSDAACIAVLSSLMGSMDDNTSGGSLMYRSSKAALNATMKSLSIDLQTDNIGVVIFHPGWVKTDMGGQSALIDTHTSVTGMTEQISHFKLAETGSFIKYDGKKLPW